jgi:hypothetical protein
MTREELMVFMSLMDYSVSQVNPPGSLVHGFGNYHVSIHGPFGSEFVNTSLLNLYFLDSGDREVVNGVKTYGWIKESQLAWLRATSQELQVPLMIITSIITAPKILLEYISVIVKGGKCLCSLLLCFFFYKLMMYM